MNLVKRNGHASSPNFSTSVENEIVSFQKEMNSLVNNFFNRGEIDYGAIMKSAQVPAMDLQEKGNKYLLDVDVPGMSNKDIDIDLHDHVLTIKGNKKTEKETNESDYICIERTQGSFRREVYLNEEVDKENVKAELKNGVLHVELTKKEANKNNHKRISIN